MCYVHNVTAVQKSGKVNYTTCELQTEKKTIKAICFSPNKVTPLRAAMENKSPTKIRRHEYNEKFNNIVIKNSTSITTHDQPLSFTAAESLTTPLATISAIKTTSPNQLIALKAIVKNVSSTKSIKMDRGDISKSSCTLQDPTGTIQAVFWEEWVGSVESGKTYLFTNFRVKKDNYNNEVYINTAKDGFNVAQCNPFEQALPDIEPGIAEILVKQATVTIIGVKTVTKYNTCNACGRKVEGTGKTVKCSFCKMKQRILPGNGNWYARVYVQNVQSKEKFYLTIFNAQLLKVLEINDKEVDPHADEETISDILLDSVNIHVTYNIGDGKAIDVNDIPV